MYYIVFCVIAIIVVCALVGTWRGLFKTLFGFLAVVISIVSTYYACPYLTQYIIQNTEIDEYIEDKIYDKFKDALEKKVEESLKDAGVTTDLENLTKQETNSLLETDPDKATQIQVIDGLNLTENIKKGFIENNNDSFYESLGITTFYRYIARYAAVLVTNALSFAMLFLVIRLIFAIIFIIINHATKKVPGLSLLNRFGGFLLGTAIGIVVVWIFMIIAGIAFGSSFDEMVAGNVILEKINDYNIILHIIMST